MSDENSYAKIRGITDIHRYIEKVSCLKNSIIILAVKDMLGCELNGEVAAEWRKLGIRKDLSNKHWRGYLYIRNGTKRAVEMMGEPDQSVAYSGKIDGHAIQIKSAPWNDGNAAEIIIDGKDYAVNQRGINIVIYDKKYHAIADAVCFDTHRKDFVCTRLADIHIRKRLALKNILPDKVEVRIFFEGEVHLWNAYRSLAQAFRFPAACRVYTGRQGRSVHGHRDHEHPQIPEIYRWQSTVSRCKSISCHTGAQKYGA